MAPIRATAAVLGVVLLVIGVSGFFGIGIAGNQDTNPIFVTGQIQDLVHIITGSLALYIAFGIAGRSQAVALVAFGALFACLIVVSINSSDLYGLLQHELTSADQALHALIAAVSIGVGGWALVRGAGTVPAG